MPDHILPATIVFGILFLICMVGLWISNANSRRLNATTPHPDQPQAWRDAPMQSSGAPRR